MASERSTFDPLSGAPWERIWELFHAALARPAEARDRFLAEECDDEALQQEVAELLAAHDAAEGPLDRAPLESDHRTEVLQGVADLAPGTVLAERFEVLRQLGSGGMGAVNEALDRELGMRVALKTLRPEIAADAEALARFRQEIALARQITHPNVCRLYDLFQHRRENGELLYFVTMELLEGESLAERIRRDGPLSPEELLPIVEQVAAGLEAAHGVGVVHRDLKPGNVLLVPSTQEDEVRAVVADFGLAVTLSTDDGTRLTRAGQILGTPAYMAPEQLTGDEVTPATDVYALGLTLYEALSGELPFAEGSPFSGALRRLATPPPALRSRVPELPESWGRTVACCLRRVPSERYPSVDEAVASLRGEPDRWLRGRRSWWVAGAAVALLFVVVLGGLWWTNLPERGERAAAPSESAAVPGRAEPLSALITGFDNDTGEEILDDVLESALRRELANSPRVSTVSRERIADTLRLMKKPVDVDIDAALGREIALRDGQIEAVLVGTAEKLGQSYLLSVEVIGPRDGSTIASLAEEAAGIEEVLPVIHRLANGIRRALGEKRQSLAEEERRLARVSTPSLRALQLFTKSQSFGFMRDARAAEELLRQAVAEDPEFASGYMGLARAIQLQGRPEEEYLPFAERAMELADSTPLAERYDLRTQYFLMRGQIEEAIAVIRAKAELVGDRAPAGLFAIYAFELGRYEEAVPYAAELAEANPNSWASNFQTARALTQWANRPYEAEPYAARATELVEAVERDDMTRIASWFASWARAFPAHLLWLEGDIEGMNELADGWYEELSIDPTTPFGEAWPGFLALVYGDIGRLRRAEEIYRASGESGREALASWRGDVETRRDLLRQAAARPLRRDQSPGWGAMLAVDLARAGLVDEARRVTEELVVRQRSGRSYGAGRRPTPAMVAAARGALALAEGRSDEAVPLLEKAARELRASGLELYFRVAETLGTLFEERRERSRAIDLLEEASRQRGRLHGESKLPWMEVRLLLADLYQREGRQSDARAISTELRRLLALADPDHVVLDRLNDLTASD